MAGKSLTFSISFYFNVIFRDFPTPCGSNSIIIFYTRILYVKGLLI